MITVQVLEYSNGKINSTISEHMKMCTRVADTGKHSSRFTSYYSKITETYKFECNKSSAGAIAIEK